MSIHRWELLKKAGYVEVRVPARLLLDTKLVLTDPAFIGDARELGVTLEEVNAMPLEAFMLYLEDALQCRDRAACRT